jgi:hypothetical protein
MTILTPKVIKEKVSESLRRQSVLKFNQAFQLVITRPGALDEIMPKAMNLLQEDQFLLRNAFPLRALAPVQKAP